MLRCILSLILLLASHLAISLAWAEGPEEAPSAAVVEMSSVELRVPGLPPTRLYTNPDDQTIRVVLERFHVWEDLETRWLLKTLRPGDTFIDVGANIGYYTVVASQVVGETGHVYAFEPDPTSFAILERNVRENGLTNVTLEQKALSNEPGSLRLYLAHENKGDHRLFDEADAPREFVDVEAVRLDDYLEGRPQKIDFIKIDTQGAEGIIIGGMLETIRNNPNLAMVVEYTPTKLRSVGTDPGEFLELLQDQDWRFFNLGMGFGDVPLVAVRGDDISREGSLPMNLFMLSGLGRLKKMDAAVLAAEMQLASQAKAGAATQRDWERKMNRELVETPWVRATAGSAQPGKNISANIDSDGCVLVRRKSNAEGELRVEIPLLAADVSALRIRSSASDTAAGPTTLLVRGLGVRRAGAAEVEALGNVRFYKPRDPDSPIELAAATLVSQGNLPGILQWPVSSEAVLISGDALVLDLVARSGPQARVCFLESRAADPTDYGVEIALGQPEGDRPTRLRARLRSEFANRDPQFAEARAELAQVRRERAAFQKLSEEGIQAWIRPAPTNPTGAAE